MPSGLKTLCWGTEQGHAAAVGRSAHSEHWAVFLNSVAKRCKLSSSALSELEAW